MVSKKDCALWRVLRGRPVCKDREGDKDPYNVDYTQPQRMVSEDGVQYAPPLRAAAEAPAASWDAAAYKTSAGAGGTVRAGDGARRCRALMPLPQAAPPAAPKPKKAKTARSAKKPSRDRAAPAS